VSETFRRILRLRALLEEQSRMQLEKHVPRAAQIEHSIAGENALATTGRRELFSLVSGSLSENESHAKEDTATSRNARETRGLANVSQELAAMRKKKLHALAKAEERRIAEQSLVFYERRKEKRQVQTVLDQEAVRAEIKRRRTEQRDLDDWYAMSEAQKRKKESARNIVE
jgi:hypothetical protein